MNDQQVVDADRHSRDLMTAGRPLADTLEAVPERYERQIAFDVELRWTQKIITDV